MFCLSASGSLSRNIHSSLRKTTDIWHKDTHFRLNFTLFNIKTVIYKAIFSLCLAYYLNDTKYLRQIINVSGANIILLWNVSLLLYKGP